jgi:hypothetical protein
MTAIVIVIFLQKESRPARPAKPCGVVGGATAIRVAESDYLCSPVR